MKLRTILTAAVLAGALVAGGATAQNANSLASGVARTKQGEVKGAVVDGVAVFRGLPYAAAPVGERRWREPGAAPTWQGVRDATKNGGSCAEVEDCLYLNVFTPANATAASKLPVFVFVHGGGFAGGSGGGTDGTKFAKAGVITVAINYRLGRAGWFAHPALTAENPRGLHGNYGNMDQIAALKWVRDNIAGYGGDPAKLTLGGSSAGAISTAYLMLAPQAKGLFSKAISESNFARLEAAPIRAASGDSAEKAGLAWAESLGIKGSGPDAAAGLRKLTLEQLRANAPAAGAGRPRPMADGVMIQATIEEGFRAGKQAAIPYLFGDTDDDSSMFRRGIDAKARVAELSKVPGFQAAYDPQNKGDADLMLAYIMTDDSNREPNRAVARLHAAKAPTYVYHFTYVPKDTRATAIGAGHSAETRYVFAGANPQRPLDAEDLAVSDKINAYFAAFIKTGNPNTAGLQAWPKYDRRTEQRLVVTKTGGLMVTEKMDAARLDFSEAQAIARQRK